MYVCFFFLISVAKISVAISKARSIGVVGFAVGALSVIELSAITIR